MSDDALRDRLAAALAKAVPTLFPNAKRKVSYDRSVDYEWADAIIAADPGLFAPDDALRRALYEFGEHAEGCIVRRYLARGQSTTGLRIPPDVPACDCGLRAALAAAPEPDPTTQPGYYCTVCPHAMHLHEDDGHCGGGCH